MATGPEWLEEYEKVANSIAGKVDNHGRPAAKKAVATLSDKLKAMEDDPTKFGVSSQSSSLNTLGPRPAEPACAVLCPAVAASVQSGAAASACDCHP